MQQHATIAEANFLRDADLRSARRPRGRPIHPMLVSFSVAYFVGALVTDIVYWQMPDVMWERFSIWLIAGGLIVSALVALAAVIDLIFARQRPAWFRAIGYSVAVLLSLLNVFVHSRDGYTAVVPTGLLLSAIVVIIQLMFMASASWALTYPRHGARS